MTAPARALPDLDALVALFYHAPEQLGQLQPIVADQMPPDYRNLLAHQHHMTVTVEHFHKSPVDVRVLDKRIGRRHYARKILLARQSDGAVVQYGIMRVNFDHLSEAVRQELVGEGKPLGRILIEHDVLRVIRLDTLWRVEPGAELAQLFDLPTPQTTYGRTAMIDCNGEPAIELLEIVAPVTAANDEDLNHRETPRKKSEK